MRYTHTTLLGLAAAALWGAADVTYAQSVSHEMTVSVVDGDGVPVTGLMPRDFIVREDNVEREVLRVRPDTEPKQIALLVDTSEAAGPAIGDFKRAAAAFVGRMTDGNEISIISFGGTPRILTNASHDPAELAEGVGKIFAYSSTAGYLLDAAAETGEGFARRGASRPIIVVLAARGVDYSSMNDQAALDRLAEAGVTIHALVLSASARGGVETTEPFGLVGPGSLFAGQSGSGAFQHQQIERDRFLDAGPAKTGGRRRDLILSTSAEDAVLELAAQIREQYLVEYARPTTLIPPERIKVDVRQADLDVRGAVVAAGNPAR